METWQDEQGTNYLLDEGEWVIIHYIDQRDKQGYPHKLPNCLEVEHHQKSGCKEDDLYRYTTFIHNKWYEDRDRQTVSYGNVKTNGKSAFTWPGTSISIDPDYPDDPWGSKRLLITRK